MVIKVNNFQTEIIIELCSKDLIRTIGKVLLRIFGLNIIIDP